MEKYWKGEKEKEYKWKEMENCWKGEEEKQVEGQEKMWECTIGKESYRCKVIKVRIRRRF